MSMRDAFSGLFPSNGTQGVSRVSGVATTKSSNKSSAVKALHSRNTSVTALGTGVSLGGSATPCTHAPNGSGVSEKSQEIQPIYAGKTPETPATPLEYQAAVDFLDMFEERAAIAEYDSGFPCPMAETIAYLDTFLSFATQRYPAIRAEFDALLNLNLRH